MHDLREFTNECEKKLPHEFARVTTEVDPKYEITAIIRCKMPMAVVEVNSTKYPYYGAPTMLSAPAVSIEESATGNPRCK